MSEDIKNIPETKDLLPVEKTSVDASRKEIVQDIISTDSADELEQLYHKFDLNNTKKNIIRIDELNDLLDAVNNQARERLTKRPDEITNKEILDYMTAIQNQIDRSQKVVDNIKDIKVQVNNTQNTNININVGEDNIALMNKESRDRITSLISQILNCDDDIIEAEVIDSDN